MNKPAIFNINSWRIALLEDLISDNSFRLVIVNTIQSWTQLVDGGHDVLSVIGIGILWTTHLIFTRSS